MLAALADYFTGMSFMDRAIFAATVATAAYLLMAD
jgi:hypothetical protein